MYWREKLDRVKKEFPASEFKDPNRRGGRIVKDIVQAFHKASPDDFFQTQNRRCLIRNGVLIRQCSVADLYRQELDRLAEGVNYWLFLIDMPMGGRFKVYDCRKDALRTLLYLSSGLERQEFYVIDKKCRWMVFFERDRVKNCAKLYKSGEAQTPFG